MPNGGDNAENIPPHQSIRVVHGGFSPSQRRRSTVPPRRISSAPDLRSQPSLDSASSMAQEDPGSPASCSFSRPSDSPPSRPNNTQGFDTLITPLPPIHPGERNRPSRSATEPLITHEPPPQQQPPPLESATRTLEEVHRLIRELQRRDRRGGVSGLWIAVRAFFGYGPAGTVARREVMSLVGKLLFGAGQIGATVAMLCVAALEMSPTNNAINEWHACRLPLGVWNAIWCIRVVLGCIMAIWGFRRKNCRRVERSGTPNEEVTDEIASRVSDHAGEIPTVARGESRLHRPEDPENRYTSTVRFARLTTLLSLFSLTWFIAAHVLIYTSIHSCRISAPHLWWLTFGIICIGYLVIVEVIVVAFIVFILGPLIFVFLNLILICMGRRPLRHPNNINPEVGKLPQKVVDLIPLVLYIPAPTPKEPATMADVSGDSLVPCTQESMDTPASPLAAPEIAHVQSYPPVTERPITNLSTPTVTPVTPSRQSRRLFTFRRIRIRMAGKNDKENEKSLGKTSEGYRYEDKWERGDYPFVKLEGNRAVCAICLCDFEEPRRVRYSVGSKPAEDLDKLEKGVNTVLVEEAQVGDGLRLADAGEGAQPLRLLACAHVFHKSCLDPWLTEVSGRCPVCQRPVEIEDPAKPERRRS